MRTFHAQGMTCTSCEVLIERKLRKIPGVFKVKVHRAQEKVEVKCADSVSSEAILEAVKGDGYILTPVESTVSHLINRDTRRYAEIGAALLLILGAYLLLSQLEIIPRNLGVTDDMSYGFIFVLGLVAATSTCLAVSGGLLLGLAAKYNEQHPDATRKQKFLPHIYFNAGRIISYTLLGGVIGLIGSVLTFSPAITGVITIMASILMIIIGVQLLGIFPWLNHIQLKMPKFLAHRIYDSHEQQQVNKTSSFLFGGATFFLPCGFTQALQLYVLSQGDFTIGAVTMLAFSLGTLPSLLSVGALTSLTKGSFQRHITTFSAVLVIVLGVFNIPSGLTLTGAGTASTFNEQQLFPNGIPIVSGVQTVQMEVNGFAYSPNQFLIQQGVPVEWQIDGSKAQGCAQIISIPGMGVTQRLSSQGITTVQFTPVKTGDFVFSCGMGMAGPGVFRVV